MELKSSVLIVDDCEDMLEIEKIFIERYCGSEAIAARSFDELKKLGDKILDCKLAFLDLNFGESEPTGIEIYHWLKKKGFANPIFFLTGNGANSDLAVEVEQLGEGTLLTKPIVPALFTKLVEDPSSAFKPRNNPFTHFKSKNSSHP
ncbi:MAG: response regulator [Pseudobdellovibrionaceae bacterium]